MVAWITLRCVECKFKFLVVLCFFSSLSLLQHVLVKMCRILFFCLVDIIILFSTSLTYYMNNPLVTVLYFINL